MTEDEYGTLERVGDVSILRFRRRLEHPRDKVWAALTENEHLEGWFPTTIEGARVAGAALHFSFREGEGEPFDGEMTAFDPPSLMELRWSDDLLRFELASRWFRVSAVLDGDLPRTREGRPRCGGLARLPRTTGLPLCVCVTSLVTAGALA